MAIHRIFALAMTSLLLSACSSYSKQEVNQQLSEFNDLDLPQLIALLGVPSRQYEHDGKTYVEWKKQDGNDSDSSISIGSGTGGRGWFGAIGMTFPINGEDAICIFRGTTDNDRQTVRDLKWQGNTNYCGEILAELNPKKKQ